MFNKQSLLVRIAVILLILPLAGCSSPASTTASVDLQPTNAPTAAPTSLPEVVNTATSAPASKLDLIWELTGDPNPFKTPVGVTIDPQGNVYVMDAQNDRVQKFDSAGNFVSMWGSKGSAAGQFATAGVWGTLGHLAADTQGNIYVVDTNNYRIQKFDSSGNYQTQWGTQGTGNGEFRFPYDIAIDSQNNVYICEAEYANVVQKFDETGKFLNRWGKKGYKDGEFAGFSCTVAIDPDDNLLVADNTGRIQKFDANGQFLSKIALPSIDNHSITAWNIAVDRQGNIYIADYDHLQIVKLDPAGQVLDSWNGTGADPVTFSSLLDIAVDQEGNIYITDALNNTVKKIRQP